MQKGNFILAVARVSSDADADCHHMIRSDISEKTVKAHRGQVTEKLGVSSVADLVRLAQKAGIEPAA